MKRYTTEQKEGWKLYRNRDGAGIGIADGLRPMSRAIPTIPASA